MSALLYALAAIAALCAFGWYMISVPGESHRGALTPLTAEGRTSRSLLQKHVSAITSAEHNTRTPERLEAAARSIESELKALGYEVRSRPGSQRYPFPLNLFYPERGDFVAFVANLASRGLLHETIGAFRAAASFPSDGVAAPAFIPGIDWSNQWSFWAHGVPALMITDTALYRYPYYHLATDTPDKLDYDRLARVVAGLDRMFRALDERL
jgi:hypothetical protein